MGQATCQDPSTRLSMLGFGGCGVTKNLEGRIVTKLISIDYEACPLDSIRINEKRSVKRYHRGCGITKNLEGRIVTKLINNEACPLNPIRTKTEILALKYQRADAKLSQVSATSSGSCRRTEESPNMAREKAPI